MREELGDLIAKNQLDEVIARLFDDILCDEKDAVELLSGRLVALRKKEQDGVISQPEALLERNQIALSLRNIIGNLTLSNTNINDEKQILTKKTPPQYKSIEDILKRENKYWYKIKLRKPKDLECLTLFYCQNMSSIIGLHRVFLRENKPNFSSYYDVAVESLKTLIELMNLLVTLFKELEITKVGEISEELETDITQIKLILLNIEDSQGFKRFHAIEIRPLLSDLATLETLLKCIYT